MNNVQGIRNSGISIAPVARLPTFSPVSSPQFQIPNSVPIHNANPYGNYNSMFNARPADTFINSVPNFSSHQLPGFQVFGGNMQNNGHFGEYHKAMLQSLLHLDKQLVDQHTEVRNVNKKDYPTFPKCDKNGMVTPEEYRAWRRAFLVQLQSDGRLNCVLLPTYVPSHTMCAVPQANDPIFGGHEVLFHNAMRVWSSMERVHNVMIDKLAIILVHVLQNCGLAQQFMNQDTIDPIKVIFELDSVFIQQTKYTKADHVRKFWNMEIESGEMFSVFLARMETARAELRDRFDHIVSDEDFQTVMQPSVGNLGAEMFSVYEPLLNSNAPLAEIKQRLIATDVYVRRSQNKLNLSNFVEQNFDRQHNRHGSPQRQMNEYSRDHRERSGTSSRYRSQSLKPDDRARSSRFDGYRDRSRYTSHYAIDRGYLGHNPSD
jgi:hypothetical protein